MAVRIVKRKGKKRSGTVRVNFGTEAPNQAAADRPSVTGRATFEDAQGHYTNQAVIQHTPREFVLDFLLALGPEPMLVSRILTSPAHAKELYEALGSNLKGYEKRFGKIDTSKTKLKLVQVAAAVPNAAAKSDVH